MEKVVIVDEMFCLCFDVLGSYFQHRFFILFIIVLLFRILFEYLRNIFLFIQLALDHTFVLRILETLVLSFQFEGFLVSPTKF